MVKLRLEEDDRGCWNFVLEGIVLIGKRGEMERFMEHICTASVQSSKDKLVLYCYYSATVQSAKDKLAWKG